MWPNAWVAAVAFAASMPLLAAQAVVAWLGALLPGAHLEATRSTLPSLFFAAFLAESAPRCGPPPGRTCAALPVMTMQLGFTAPVPYHALGLQS